MTSAITAIDADALASKYITDALSGTKSGQSETEGAFSALLSSAMQMVKETNQLSNAANVEQMNFAMG